MLLVLVSSCQVKRPKTVMSDSKMENVLYDYHIAKAMSDELPYSDNYKKVLYVESVFQKYGITQADFDTSMVWFARNPDVIAKVYENVNKRLKGERDLVNRLIALRDDKPIESLPGDSIDVWAWRHIYRLTGVPLDNKLTFVFPADSNFQERDTLRWSVRFRFYPEQSDSLRVPIMSMQLVYANDSLISDLRKIYASGVESLTLTSDTLGEIKEVRGFVYYPSTSLSDVLWIDSVSLMRYHVVDSLALEQDSLALEQDSLALEHDSLALEHDSLALERLDSVIPAGKPRPDAETLRKQRPSPSPRSVIRKSPDR
jgi:hypothetical protein